MKKFLLLCLVLVVASCLRAQMPRLTGHWRRIGMGKDHDSSSKQHQYGDLILAPDSTYIIVGDEDALKSETPGWNTEETMRGKWQLNSKTLYLPVAMSMPDFTIPFAYTIIRLTKSELHLQSKIEGIPVMKYRRVDEL